MMRSLSAMFVLVSCALTSVAWAQRTDEIAIPQPWLEASPSGPWVATLAFETRAQATALRQRIDVWKLLREQNRLEALVTADQYRQLTFEGFELALDEAQTRALARLGIPLAGQGGGIPGFPCYRTVSETYATAQALATAHPQLASWIDVGDSWEKTQDAQAGWDLRVLKLTQSGIGGPKPAFFANFAIHAREYTTAELGTRFAEFLVDQYGTDPDVTWLLDHHEVHLMLQSNPDGRVRAEAGALWRKNTNNDICSNTNTRGVDLNRNFEFRWDCCNGASNNQCSEVFRGPNAASEPEIQSIQDYVRSIFPDQRGPGLDDPAPDDATGVAIDVHASGRLVILPWTSISTPTANGAAFNTLGRKIAFFNSHFPLQGAFGAADGASVEFFYGELGVAGLAFELGSQFFENCDDFENDVLGVNIQALLYAAKTARTPYLLPAGPEAFDVAVSMPSVAPGANVLLTATLDDTRFSQANGTEPTQTIAIGEAFLDVPPWDAAAVPRAMLATDGTFDEGSEDVELLIDTTDLVGGRHIIYVQGTDTDGNVGVVAAVFLEIVVESIFSDGFESGDLSAWSSSSP